MTILHNKTYGTNLGDSIEIVPISQIGTPYTVILKEITIDEKVYEPVSKEAITGRLILLLKTTINH